MMDIEHFENASSKMVAFIYQDYDFFQEDDYRVILKKILKSGGKSSITISSLASKIDVDQAQLSRCINLKGHLTEDQLFLVIHALSIKPQWHKYICLLRSYQTSKLKARRDQLFDEIKNARKAIFSTKKDIPNDRYLYSEYISSIIFCFLTIPKFQQEIDSIPKLIGITHEQFWFHVEKMIFLELLQNSNDKIYANPHAKFHLETDDELFQKVIDDQLRYSLSRKQKIPKNNRYLYAATFSASKKFEKDIINRLQDLKCYLVQNCTNDACEDVFHINLELFDFSRDY